MTAHQLRSRNWFGQSDLDGFVHSLLAQGRLEFPTISLGAKYS